MWLAFSIFIAIPSDGGATAGYLGHTVSAGAVTEDLSEKTLLASLTSSTHTEAFRGGLAQVGTGYECCKSSTHLETTEPLQESAVEVTVARPFIFLIRNIETGAILFVGRVVNPST